MRKLVLAALAAWVVLLPSVVHAQWRVEGQGRPYPPQIQQPYPPDVRRGGGFARMLRDIARSSRAPTGPTVSIGKSAGADLGTSAPWALACC